MAEDDADREAVAVDGAGMSRLFSPSGRETDRGRPEDDAAEIVGAYVLALDPGIARVLARRRRGRG